MRHIETFEVTIREMGHKPQAFVLPSTRKNEVKRLLSRLQGRQEGSVSARQVLPEVFDSIQGPAIALRGLRHREELTQKQLAEKLGIHQHHLSEMEHGKRPIGKAMAKKLAEALNANWRIFI